MANVYVQRIFDTGLSQYVRYETVIPTDNPNPAITVPTGSGTYSAATHAIESVYDNPNQDYLGGVAVTTPMAPALNDVPTYDGSEYTPAAGGGGGSPAASAVTYSDGVTPAYSATNVQDALDAIKPLLANTGPVIWQPGGVAAGNVYTTWSSVYAAVNARPVGQREVIIDTSLGAATVTGAPNFDCSNWIFRGAQPTTLVTFDDVCISGSTSSHIQFEDLYISVVTNNNLVFVTDGMYVYVSLRNCVVDTAANVVAFYAFGTLASALLIYADNTQFVSVASPHMFFNRNPACTYAVALDGNSNANASYLFYTDAATTTNVRLISSAARYSTTQTWGAGTINVVYDPMASGVTYDDSVSPALSATTVQGAIDAIKPKVATFGAATSGIVGASGGGTTNFLRADGTWTAPPDITSDILFQWNGTDLTQFAQRTMKTSGVAVVSSVGTSHRNAACIDTLYGVPPNAWDTRLLLVTPGTFVGGALPARYTIEMEITHLEGVIIGPVAFYKTTAEQGMAVFANETGVNAYVQKYDAAAILGQAIGSGAQLAATAASGNASRGGKYEFNIEPANVAGQYYVWADMHSHSWWSYTIDANLLGESDASWTAAPDTVGIAITIPTTGGVFSFDGKVAQFTVRKHPKDR